MARKRNRHEEHDNLERWLVSYADFITLLFAFFVVMYAISSINEGKYRVLSDTLITAFNTTPKSVQPVQVGDDGLSGRPRVIEPVEHRAGDPPDNPIEQLVQIATDFEQAMLPFIEDEMVRVRREDFWVELELNTSFLFESGSAELEDTAIPILQRIANVLKKYPNQIQVEGFTDNVPINTYAFPSNWELSAARAASVVHVFMNQGVKPENMSAVGFGEYRPVADNATAAGRMRNRRVLVVVLADKDSRRLLEIQRSGGL
ncbi:MAG: flagellar motor protein MotD [Thiohalomonadaceae bacterium]